MSLQSNFIIILGPNKQQPTTSGWNFWNLCFFYFLDANKTPYKRFANFLPPGEASLLSHSDNSPNWGDSSTGMRAGDKLEEPLTNTQMYKSLEMFQFFQSQLQELVSTELFLWQQR